MHQNLLAYGFCYLAHFDYGDNKRVCNERASDDLWKANGAQMATFAAASPRADINDLRKTMATLGTRLGSLVGPWSLDW